MKLNQAILEGVKNCNRWMGGATIVKNDNINDYCAIPSAWINDASYTGSKDIVLTINDPVEVFGNEDLKGWKDKDLLKYLDDEFIPCLMDAADWNQTINQDLTGL